MEAAQRQSFPVRIQEAATEIAEREVRRNRAGHLPTVDVVATYGNNVSTGSATSASGGGTEVRSTTLGLQVTLPLYAGGAIDSRVRESMANYEREIGRAHV